MHLFSPKIESATGENQSMIVMTNPPYKLNELTDEEIDELTDGYSIDDFIVYDEQSCCCDERGRRRDIVTKEAKGWEVWACFKCRAIYWVAFDL